MINILSVVSNSTTSAEEMSLLQLQRMLGLNIFIFIIIAPASAFSNIVTLFILMLYRKTFKSHHYNLLRHMIAVSVVQAVYLFANAGLTRIIETIAKIPDNGTVLVCSLRFLPVEITSIVERFNFFILALDRFIAVTFPFYYKTLDSSKKYIVITVSIPWIVAIVECTTKHILLDIENWNSKILALCLWANTRTDDFLNYVNIEGMVIDGMIIVIYILSAIIGKHKRAISGNTQEESSFKLMIVCGIDAIIYTCTYFFSNIYSATIVLRAATDDRIVLGPVVFLCMLLSTMPRFLINFKWNKKFRKQAKILFACKDNEVTDISLHVRPTHVT